LSSLQDQPDQGAGKIAISVVHGHLAFARYPVLVGHYEGDAFSGSEAQLDRTLGLQLTVRRRLGLYPGAIGTSSVVLDPAAKPPGAVVAGLGQVADMTVGLLRQTLRHALLAFATADVDRIGHQPDRLALSALGVGTGEGGVDITTGVIAMLQAVIEAQRVLAQVSGSDCRVPYRFAAFEIVELFEDRALAIWNAARHAVEEQPDCKASFELAGTIEPRKGGRRRSPPGRDPSWWQPITIRMLGDDRSDRRLQFELSDGRARAERLIVPADLDLVEPLVTRAVRHIDPEGVANSAGRVLFELLLPPALKDRSAEERSRRLILDPESACFPWELLDDRRPWPTEAGSDQLRPPAVRAGLVRQLLQVAGPDRIRLPQPRTALVIGDPRALPMDGFVPLQGARDEATTVAALLKEQGYEVKTLIGDKVTPDQICRNLFSRDWEIIHIAAHGVVATELPRPDGVIRKVTGIVLGGGVVLGPSALSKLPASPNVAFINCCHLGKIDAAAEEQAQLGAVAGRPELAASVAVQLIRSGARCVVAAGWAIDDDKAKDFARTFYEQMLAGFGFGDATLAARHKACTPGADSNTWGAYQCYGDPDYHLSGPGPVAAKSPVKSFALIEEAIESADQVREEANISLERHAWTSQRARLDAIAAQAEQKQWLGDPTLRSALGRAYGALSDHDAAIAHYQAALASADGRVPAVILEQLTNLGMRRSFRLARAASPEDRPSFAREIEEAKARLATLATLFGETGERLALQAGCCKRLAQLAQLNGQPNEAKAQLQQMQALYRRAAEVATSTQTVRWTLQMQGVAKLCLAMLEDRDPKPAVAELEPLACPQPIDGNDFWSLIAAADVATLIMIAGHRFDDWDEIRKRYRTAWAHVGSPLHLDSVVEQLAFYQDMLGQVDCLDEAERSALASRLSDIRTDLDAMTQESNTSG
jgi:tetratricopeptide (TPR) repeat protein